MSLSNVTVEDLLPLIENAVGDQLLTVDPDANLYDEMGMDSIGIVALSVDIRRVFGVRIPDENFPHLLSPRQLAEEINRIANASFQS